MFLICPKRPVHFKYIFKTLLCYLGCISISWMNLKFKKKEYTLGKKLYIYGHIFYIIIYNCI